MGSVQGPPGHPGGAEPAVRPDPPLRRRGRGGEPRGLDPRDRHPRDRGRVRGGDRSSGDRPEGRRHHGGGQHADDQGRAPRRAGDRRRGIPPLRAAVRLLRPQHHPAGDREAGRDRGQGAGMKDDEGREAREREVPQGPRVRVTDKRRVGQEGEPAEPAEPGALAPSEASLPDEVGEARARAAEYLDHLQRLKAEFENYRKRVVKEQTRALEYAAEGVVRRLLEVVDEFQLALMAAGAKPDFDRFLRGVELVYAKLSDILHEEGLAPIEARGKPFDPELHEALMQTDEGEGEAYVADVLRPGYTLKGRVLRPAGVRVARR